jgi:hypothetical protein
MSQPLTVSLATDAAVGERRVQCSDSLPAPPGAFPLQVVPLLPDEANIHLVPSNLSITALSFYKGDAAAAAAFLRKRVFSLVAVNPWLCARVVKRPGSPLHACCELWVPKLADHKRVMVEMESSTLVPGMVRRPQLATHLIKVRARVQGRAFGLPGLPAPRAASPLNLSNTLPTLRPFVVTFRAVDAAGNAATPVSGGVSMHWTAGGMVM